MEITELNEQQLAHFVKKQCALPNKCYANCAKIVYSLRFGNYVLCKISDKGEMIGHAVVEHEQKYYDPTLQNNASIACKYELVKSFSRDELLQLMKSSGGFFNENGDYYGYPPALMNDNSIKCVDVSLSSNVVEVAQENNQPKSLEEITSPKLNKPKKWWEFWK